MRQHYWSNGFLRQRQQSGVELVELLHSTKVWWPVSVLGLSLSPFLSFFTKVQQKDNEELTYFSGLSDEAGVHLNTPGGGSEQSTERSCHISSKLSALCFCFLHFSLFVSFHPSLPNRIPRPHTHSWRFIYFQSVSFSLLHSFSLQLAEIIGGQLLQ